MGVSNKNMSCYVWTGQIRIVWLHHLDCSTHCQMGNSTLRIVPKLLVLEVWKGQGAAGHTLRISPSRLQGQMACSGAELRFSVFVARRLAVLPEVEGTLGRVLDVRE